MILVIVITKLIRNARRKRKNVPAKAKKGEGSKISEALMETQIIARLTVKHGLLYTYAT